MTKHTPVTAAAVVHTFRGPPKVCKVKALAFKRTPAETKKEQSDQCKLCMFENGPFFFPALVHTPGLEFNKGPFP